VNAVGFSGEEDRRLGEASLRYDWCASVLRPIAAVAAIEPLRLKNGFIVPPTTDLCVQLNDRVVNPQLTV